MHYTSVPGDTADALPRHRTRRYAACLAEDVPPSGSHKEAASNDTTRAKTLGTSKHVIKRRVMQRQNIRNIDGNLVLECRGRS